MNRYFPSCYVAIAGTANVMQIWKELFVVEDGEIIALVDEDSDPLLEDKDDAAPSLNRTITGFFHWFGSLQMILVLNNVNVLDTSVVEVNCFEEFSAIFC